MQHFEDHCEDPIFPRHGDMATQYGIRAHSDGFDTRGNHCPGDGWQDIVKYLMKHARIASLLAAGAAVIAAALVASTSASVKQIRDVDPCPSSSAVVSSGITSLDQALAALHRRAAVVYADLTIGMDGRRYPITPANTSVSEAVVLSSSSRGELADWYKTAVRRCGRRVAEHTWAFRLSFSHAPIAPNGSYIALLAKTRGGWRLYGSIQDWPPK